MDAAAGELLAGSALDGPLEGVMTFEVFGRIRSEVGSCGLAVHLREIDTSGGGFRIEGAVEAGHVIRVESVAHGWIEVFRPAFECFSGLRETGDAMTFCNRPIRGDAMPISMKRMPDAEVPDTGSAGTLDERFESLLELRIAVGRIEKSALGVLPGGGRLPGESPPQGTILGRWDLDRSLPVLGL
jgi:hypothetical protein